MTNKLAKTRHQSISHAELEGGAPRTSASSTQAVLPWKQQRQALKTLKQVQGDGAYFNNNAAFTLIELLVVVLIIGILASVALPQYNKAVRKARLSEVSTTFNAISKGIDAWLLENGGFGSAQFSGTNKTVTLDIAPTCDSEDSSQCYTRVGTWDYYCESASCHINLFTSPNKWLDNSAIGWHKYGDGQWGMNAENVTSSVLPDVCRWWKDLAGADRVIGSGGAPSDLCAAYF